MARAEELASLAASKVPTALLGAPKKRRLSNDEFLLDSSRSVWRAFQNVSIEPRSAEDVVAVWKDAGVVLFLFVRHLWFV